MEIQYYDASRYGESAFFNKFWLQREDARMHFTSVIRPRLDKSYKLYTSFVGDRGAKIKPWQANIFVPYIQAAVETLMPRILDARPDLGVISRNEKSRDKAPKVKMLLDYDWEKSKGDDHLEDIVRSSLVYGSGYGLAYWKTDVRKQQFLDAKKSKKGRDGKIKAVWKEEERTFYDGPAVEWVDNYDLWYDWHNVRRESKQFWFRRRVLTAPEIRFLYPMADPVRIDMGLRKRVGDWTDYAVVRRDTKAVSPLAIRDSGSGYYSGGAGGQIYATNQDPDLFMHEVFEWWRPFEDAYAVMVNDVPILPGGAIPIPYNHKETPIFSIPFMRLPGEFEGVGLPLILESPQLMLNTIKNQRIDSATLRIHTPFVVNPLANVNRDDLVVQPFGIIWSSDPNGVRELQLGDVKQSAYEEEQLLKSDLRYASGVDDFSMGSGGAGSTSATEVRHLRESTLERVRLFINHLGSGLSDMERWWIDMRRQFWRGAVERRIIGVDGQEQFVPIESDDLKGEFEFKATVTPSIAGQSDVDKKQAMDLFQLLSQVPGIDLDKLFGFVVSKFNMSLNDFKTQDKANPMAQQPVGPDGQPLPPQGAQSGPPPAPDLQAMLGGPQAQAPAMDPSVLQSLLGGAGVQFSADQANPYAQASSPIDLTSPEAMGGTPPTAPGIPNPSGANMNGKVNTTIPNSGNVSTGDRVMAQALNLQ